jgi:hypothetical protein
LFAYGLAILPLIRKLKAKFTQVNQPWYADDAGADGNFRSIRHFFLHLQEIGLDFGYFPEPSKSILVVHEHNLEKARSAFADHEFQITTSSRYLSGFIAEEEALRSWMKEKTTLWTTAIPEIALASKNFPQSTYVGLQKSLQQEWQFVQRVVKDSGEGPSSALKKLSPKLSYPLFLTTFSTMVTLNKNSQPSLLNLLD